MRGPANSSGNKDHRDVAQLALDRAPSSPVPSTFFSAQEPARIAIIIAGPSLSATAFFQLRENRSHLHR
jgi:hypothetical protein